MLSWHATALLALLAFVIGDRACGQIPTPTPFAGPTRVVEFPAHRSLGLLSSLPLGGARLLPGDRLMMNGGAIHQGEAIGKVTVPADRVLILTLMNNGGAGSEYEDLATLAPDAIQSIEFPACPNGDDDLRHIRGLTGLIEVSLQGVEEITDAAMDHLSALPNLWYLNLAACSITDAGLARLKNRSALRGLNLNQTGAGAEGLAPLRECSALEHLELRDTIFGADAMRVVASLSRLQFLALSRGSSQPWESLTDAHMGPLAGLAELGSLDLVVLQVWIDR